MGVEVAVVIWGALGGGSKVDVSVPSVSMTKDTQEKKTMVFVSQQ